MECVERLSLEGWGVRQLITPNDKKNEKEKKKEIQATAVGVVILNQTLALLYQFTKNDGAFLYLESDAPCYNTAEANI